MAMQRRYAAARTRSFVRCVSCTTVASSCRTSSLQNILLDAYEEPVIADFGISELLRTQTRLMPSSIRGTFNYMAPEAFDPEELGGAPPTDVWAMACVTIEMFTGTVPWAGMPMQQISRAVCDRLRTPSVPENAFAAQLLRRCFSYAPAERPTAAELTTAFAPEVSAASPREAPPLPEQLTALGAQLERLAVEKTVALEELRESREENQRLRAAAERQVAEWLPSQSVVSPT